MPRITIATLEMIFHCKNTTTAFKTVTKSFKGALVVTNPAFNTALPRFLFKVGLFMPSPSLPTPGSALVNGTFH